MLWVCLQAFLVETIALCIFNEDEKVLDNLLNTSVALI